MNPDYHNNATDTNSTLNAAYLENTSKDQALRQRIIFLESLCLELKASADQSRTESENVRKTLAVAEIRENKLHYQIEELEKELNKKGHEILETTERLAFIETKRTEAEVSNNSFKKKMSLELQLTQMELAKERRVLTLLSGKFNDAQNRLNYLERSYQRLFEKMFELYESIQSGTYEQFDLADFISEMRAEIVSLEELLANSKAREESLRIAMDKNVDKVSDHMIINRPSQQSILYSNPPLASSQTQSMHQQSPSLQSFYREPKDYSTTIINDLLNPADRPLAYRFISELEQGPDSIREHAGKRLLDLLGKHASAFILNAIQQTKSPAVRATLIAQLGKTSDQLLFSVIARFMDDPDSSVRIAALDTCSILCEENNANWIQCLHKGLHDVSTSVRRRAAMHAAMARHIDAGPLCHHLLMDSDPTTRRLCCTSVAATKNPETALTVLSLIIDEDTQVCLAAVNAVEQIFGISLAYILPWSNVEKKNHILKLSTYIQSSKHMLYPEGKLLDSAQLKTVLRSKEWNNTVRDDQIIDNSQKIISDLRPSIPKETSQDPSLILPQQNLKPKSTLDFSAIKKVLQSTLFGCLPEDIMNELHCSEPELELSLSKYLDDGKIIRRGKKLFLP